MSDKVLIEAVGEILKDLRNENIENLNEIEKRLSRISGEDILKSSTTAVIKSNIAAIQATVDGLLYKKAVIKSNAHKIPALVSEVLK